jgi:hypothetical protein
MKHKGKDLLILLNDVAIANSKSCDINMDCEEIETSSPDDGNWKHFIPRRMSWKVTTSYLVEAKGTPIKSCLSLPGKIFTIKVESRDLSDDVMTGQALCTNCKITGTKGNLTQGSFTFLGIGALK